MKSSLLYLQISISKVKLIAKQLDKSNLIKEIRHNHNIKKEKVCSLSKIGLTIRILLIIWKENLLKIQRNIKTVSGCIMMQNLIIKMNHSIHIFVNNKISTSIKICTRWCFNIRTISMESNKEIHLFRNKGIFQIRRGMIAIQKRKKNIKVAINYRSIIHKILIMTVHKSW